MIAYKLVRQRADGTLGPLFIDARLRLQLGTWLEARHDVRRKGFAFRPGWHCTAKPEAPHLSPKGRVWLKVEIDDYEEHRRPANQGGLWYLANRMKILEVLPCPTQDESSTAAA
jgi:hypothetical protein